MSTMRDLSPTERREHMLDQLYAKLEEPDLPAHAYARITSSIAQLEKLAAAAGGEDDKPVAQDLGPALQALPVEHATEILVDEIHRLEIAASSYRERLVELVGDEAAAQALTI
jgi:hypothetical protein